jgi:hypothetical protein
MAVWGGAGWLLDLWLDIKVFVPVGIILGMAVSIYMVVVKYGGAPPTPGRPGSKEHGTSTTPGGRRSRPRAATRTQKGQR